MAIMNDRSTTTETTAESPEATEAPPELLLPESAAEPPDPADTAAPAPIAAPWNWRLAVRWSMVAAALFAVGWLLWSAQAVLLPFIIGLVLAYLMIPFVNIFSRTMPRPLAILAVYLISGSLVVASLLYVVPLLANQVIQLANRVPTIESIQETANNLLRQYRELVPDELKLPIENSLNQALVALQANVATYAQSAGSFLLNRVLALLNSITFILGFLTLPIWLFYVLNDHEQGRTAIDDMLHPGIRADFWNLWKIIDTAFGAYVRGQLILCLSVGAAVGIGLFGLELAGIPVGDYILVLALIAGVTEFIPVLGPTLGSIPGVLIGLTISPVAGVAMLLLYIIVQQLENSFLVPRIIGDSINIHPAVLTVAMIVMGTLFGLVGIILAAPALAITRDLFLYTYRRLEGLVPAAAYDSLGHTHR
jgi:predicted PurR-regulated permease PerM